MVVIKKLGVLSVAKLQGLIGAVIGLIAGIFMAIISSMMSAIAPPGTVSMFGGLGIAAIIVLPIMYGIIGFVGGAIGAWIYNIFAGWVGGIEMDLDK